MMGATPPGTAARPVNPSPPSKRCRGESQWEAAETKRLEGWVRASGYTAAAPAGTQEWVEEISTAEAAAVEADGEFASLVECESCHRTWGGAAQCDCSYR